MIDLFTNFRKISNSPIMVGQLPEILLKEIESIVETCSQIRKHPLSELKMHRNGGKNSYQVSVPYDVLLKGWLFAYLIRLGEYYLGITDLQSRSVRIAESNGHFDHFDVWVNFAEVGDSNPPHTHRGDLSGVIYWENIDNESTYWANSLDYNGQKGEIAIFPSGLEHWVETKTTQSQRITLSFNLVYCDASAVLEQWQSRLKSPLIYSGKIPRIGQSNA